MQADPRQVEACVEALCQQGCQAVRGIIADLEAGRAVPHTEALNAAERASVLAELQAIMAVYDGTCPADGVLRRSPYK